MFPPKRHKERKKELIKKWDQHFPGLSSYVGQEVFFKSPNYMDDCAYDRISKKPKISHLKFDDNAIPFTVRKILYKDSRVILVTDLDQENFYEILILDFYQHVTAPLRDI